MINTILFSFNPFAGLQEDIILLTFAFKIVILLFIIQFFRNRFGDTPIVTILVAGMGYLFLFTDYFYIIFGPMMFIYMFITFGFTTILFDLAIAKPWKKMDMGGGDDQQQEKVRMMKERY